MNPELLSICLVSLTGGILAARHVAGRRRKAQLATRLSKLAQAEVHQPPATVLKIAAPRIAVAQLHLAAPPKLEQLTLQSGWSVKPETIAAVCLLTFVIVAALGVLSNANLPFCLVLAGLLAALPVVALMVQRSKIRRRFAEQLPDAIDLMVSVLRSGHSVPQAVRTAGEEISAPCGPEFAQVLQRMNLGQPLPEALSISAVKYNSYELDLIRRAIAIQTEIGGSLAELLDKTNKSLRQRIKLARQVHVLTSQSRLTALIVGMLPIVVALALQFLSPGYLDPLMDSALGRALLMVAISLELLGLFIMKKMSTMKV